MSSGKVVFEFNPSVISSEMEDIEVCKGHTFHFRLSIPEIKGIKDLICQCWLERDGGAWESLSHAVIRLSPMMHKMFITVPDGDKNYKLVILY